MPQPNPLLQYQEQEGLPLSVSTDETCMMSIQLDVLQEGFTYEVTTTGSDHASFIDLTNGSDAERNAVIEFLNNEINGKKAMKGEKRDRKADVSKFLSDHRSGAAIGDVQVSELRHIVPLFLLATYPEKYGRNSCKVKGMWDSPPPDWPSNVPFVDPNNNVKKVDGRRSSKPTKDILVIMLKHLMKKYREKQQSVGMKASLSSPHSPYQVEDSEDVDYYKQVECHSDPVVGLDVLITEKLHILEMRDSAVSAYLRKLQESLLLRENDVVSLKSYQLLYVIDYILKYNAFPSDFEELLGDKQNDLVANVPKNLDAGLFEDKPQSKVLCTLDDEPLIITNFNSSNMLPEIMNIEPRQGASDQDALLSNLNLRIRLTPVPQSSGLSGVQESNDEKFVSTVGEWVEDPGMCDILKNSHFNIADYLCDEVEGTDIVLDENFGKSDPWFSPDVETLEEVELMEVENTSYSSFSLNAAVFNFPTQPIGATAYEQISESSQKLMYSIANLNSLGPSEVCANVISIRNPSERALTMPFNQMTLVNTIKPELENNSVGMSSGMVSHLAVKPTGASVAAAERSARQMHKSADFTVIKRSSLMPAPIPIMVELENADHEDAHVNGDLSDD